MLFVNQRYTDVVFFLPRQKRHGVPPFGQTGMRRAQ
jgi:hypothetical protein